MPTKPTYELIREKLQLRESIFLPALSGSVNWILMCMYYRVRQRRVLDTSLVFQQEEATGWKGLLLIALALFSADA